MLAKPRCAVTALTAVVLALLLAALSGCKSSKDKTRVSNPEDASFHKMETSYYLNSDGTATLTGLQFSEEQTTLDIPETIDGKTITKLDFSSNHFHYNIKEVTSFRKPSPGSAKWRLSRFPS